MNEKELLARMEQSIINYDKDEAVQLARVALDEGIEPTQALNEGLIKGIGVVGDLFGKTELFLPELVMAGEAMSAASSILEEAIKKAGGQVKYLARGVSGTVQGDIHDIGIKLVTTFLNANGFDILFLGTDISSSLFIDEVRESKAELLLLSALLPTTMLNQKDVIEGLKDAGIRDSVKVLVGGAPVTQDWADQIGADGYGVDASAAVQVAKKLVDSLGHLAT